MDFGQRGHGHLGLARRRQQPLGHQLALPVQGQRLVGQLGSHLQPDASSTSSTSACATTPKASSRPTARSSACSASALNYTAPQLFPDNNRLGTIPRATNWGGVRGTNGVANINWLDRWGEVGNDYIKPSFANNLSWNRGNHSLKFGALLRARAERRGAGRELVGRFQLRRQRQRATPPRSATRATPTPTRSSAISATTRSRRARPFTNLELTLFQWYGQDQWKASRQSDTSTTGCAGAITRSASTRRAALELRPELFNRANAPLLFDSACAVAFTPPATCPAASRRARNPATGELHPELAGANANLVGAIRPRHGQPHQRPRGRHRPETPSRLQGRAARRLGAARRVRVGHLRQREDGAARDGRRLPLARASAAARRAATSSTTCPSERTSPSTTATSTSWRISTARRQLAPARSTRSRADSQHADELQLLARHPAGHRLRDRLEVSYVGSTAGTSASGATSTASRTARSSQCPRRIEHPLRVAPVQRRRPNNDFLRPFRGYGDINMVM